jgi:hypothetical protein
MRPPLPRSAAASLAAHTLLIAAGVLATARPAHTRPGPERVYSIPYIPPPPPAPTPPRRSSGGSVGSTAAGHGAGLPAPPTTVDIPSPAPVPDGGCGQTCFQPDTTWQLRSRGGQPTALANQLATADAVDVTAAVIPGAPPPAYPSMMRDAGIGASLTVQFIVDTAGRAGPPSVLAATVDGDARDAFLSAIQTSLARTRFRPATIRGQPVRQLVQQQFDFVPLR